MPEQPKSITAWAIKAPDGEIYEVAKHKSTVIDNLFDAPSDWQKAYDAGYRCVQVHITEAVPE